MVNQQWFKKQEGADYIQVSKSTLERFFDHTLLKLELTKEDTPDYIQEKTTLFKKIIDDTQLNERNPKQGYHWEFSEEYLIQVKKETLEYTRKKKEYGPVLEDDHSQEEPDPTQQEKVEEGQEEKQEAGQSFVPDKSDLGQDHEKKYLHLLESQVVEKDATIKDLRETNKFLANSNNSLTETLLMLSPGKSPAEEPVDEKKETL